MIYASVLKLGSFKDEFEVVKPQDYLISYDLKIYNEYLFTKDKLRMLAARILLKNMLNRISAKPFDLKNIEKDKNGKPYLEGLKGLGISHSSEMVAVAISEKNMIGIDLQKIGKMTINDFGFELDTYERKNYLASDKKNKKEFLYNTWTMKECVVKADGMGLIGIEHVRLDRINNVAFFNNRHWYFRKTPSIINYSVALCSDNASSEVNWLDANNLALSSK